MRDLIRSSKVGFLGPGFLEHTPAANMEPLGLSFAKFLIGFGGFADLFRVFVPVKPYTGPPRAARLVAAADDTGDKQGITGVGDVPSRLKNSCQKIPCL